MSDSSRDFGRELYPFLYSNQDDGSASLATLLATVERSTLDKCKDVIALRTEMVQEFAVELGHAADAMAQRFASGGTLLTFGNGGSATDADDAASDCMMPPTHGWRRLPAISLAADGATISAVANDVGVESMFLRPLIALGAAGDIALGFSTSGSSANVALAFREARRRGMLTIAFTGYDGGEMKRAGHVDFCFVARREFVPRIQEGHATLWHMLIELIHERLAATPAVAS